MALKRGPMHAAALAFALVASLAATAQPPPQEKPVVKPPKKGDVITIKGCLDGTALVATEISAGDTTESLTSEITFRLTGSKDVLKKLRGEFDGRVVELSGTLKSTLQHGQGTQIGNTRIHIGIRSPQPGTPAEQATRSLPVVEVKSYEGSTIICKR